MEFLLAVYVLAKALSISLPLSRQLQTENLDLVKAIELAEDVSQAVMELRRKAEEDFKEIYTEVNRKWKPWELLSPYLDLLRINNIDQTSPLTQVKNILDYPYIFHFWIVYQTS